MSLLRIVTKLCIGCLLCLIDTVVPPCFAQNTTGQNTKPTQVETDRLLQQLQTGSRAERLAAENALVELGPSALARLPVVTDETPEELRSRLVRIRSALEQRESPQSRLKASRVTLAGRMKLSAALKTMEQQTTNRVVDYRDRYVGAQTDPEVETDFKDAPYLEALDNILDQAGLKPSLFSGEAGVLAIVNRDPGEQPSQGRVAYDGPFRVAATRVVATRELGNPDKRLLQLGMVIGWEPRGVPMTVRFDPAHIDAVYDDGTRAVFRERVRAHTIPVQEAVAGIELEFPFTLPPRQTTKIARLTGALTASIPGGRTRLLFDNLSNTREREDRAGGLTVTVQRARRDGQLVDLILVIKFDSVDYPLSTYRGWVFQNPAVVQDSQGIEHEYVGLETMFQRKNALALAYKFDVGGALNELTLAYDVPSSVILQEFTFELNDIELP